MRKQRPHVTTPRRSPATLRAWAPFRLGTLLVLALLLWPALGRGAVAIPPYTPNVVDPAGALSADDTQRINAALQRLRERQHIWGAVYIVPSLQDESIERLAERAFRTWRLGRQGSDNGLLLVLAMQDRRSRFEVGYGLEGVLPDVVARHALDDYLAPRLRQGETADAIVAAFDFMGRAAAQDPEAVAELAQPADDGMDWRRGAIAWAGLLVLVWLLLPLRSAWTGILRRRLLRRHPRLSGKPEKLVQDTARGGFWAWFIRLFLSANPGIFVFLLSARSMTMYVIFLALELLILVLTLAFATQRYRSPQRYSRFLQALARRRSALIRKGHIAETAPGVFAYTASYYAAQAAKERAAAESAGSSSSSSSSSSSDSSSGGGSSGGGGASSSW
ncbi:TPM domain-containing protein [Xanthomonas sacchari]|uniref:TPM domain-containing protein n=1 Tax=Xanthomonas sacchari TaxID=56458 RepID=UPI003B21F60C